MSYVLLYKSGENVLERAPEHFPAHLARCEEFAAQGSLLAYGTFGDPQAQGSMAIFTSREAAEAFVAGDPFVLHGVVCAHEIRAWNNALAPG
ncbi:MAG: YciI family protein [Solirubrobacteraceae bacterium]